MSAAGAVESTELECPSCAHANPICVKFCGECGARLVTVCPVCGAANPAGELICVSCEAPLLISCAACASSNPAGQKFCWECGTALSGEETALGANTAPSGTGAQAGEPTPIPLGSRPGFDAALVIPPASPPVEEERRLITAIFCDMVGFTPLNELLDAEDVRQIQSMYFTTMAEQLHRFGGSVEKYAGDAVLALFGNPVAHEDDAERAVRCGLAMQEAFKPISEMAMREYGRELAVRIGINTGRVISGAWDVEGKLDYSATGDALNTAARLQTAADPGGIIVGPMTMHLARRSIRFGPRQDLTLKGKSEPFPAYKVEGLRDQIAERWETAEWRSPLVGRDEELSVLMDAWKRVQDGEGQLVTLIAEAGVGKSRLLAEAVERMSRVAGTVTVRGRGMSHGEAMSLHLVADLMRSISQLHESDPPERVREQVRTTVEALLAPHDVETRDAAADVLGEVLGLLPGDSSVTNAGPQVRRQVLVRSLQLLLAALAGFRPAIILLEDLHWVDSASVEVLDAVLPALGDRQAIVLATQRPGRPFPWEGRLETTTLRLEPLGGTDAITLARVILGGAQLDEELSRQITERAGGNPFFVEELLRNLQETGALDTRADPLRLKPGAAENLPATLTELLMARLDQLDRRSRSTAQLGSVIGRTFAVPLLAAVAGENESRLQEPLDNLEHAEIALPRHNAEQEYVFKHATIREVAYDALLLRRRRALHLATAQAVIRLYPADEYVDVIAYHFSQTTEHADAAHWLERSGDRAASVFANQQAIEQYRQVRERQELIDAPPAARAQVEEKLGRILRVVGQYDEALAPLDAAVEGFRRAGDVEAERRVTAEIGRLHRARGTPAEGIARITVLLEAQQDSQPTSGLAALNVVLARLYYNLGKYDEDFKAASRGAELASGAGDPRVLAEAEMARGTALYHLRRIDDALGVLENAIPLAETVGDFEVLSILLANISVVYRDAGQLERSLHHQEHSARVSERTGDLAHQAFALYAMGEVTFVLGDWDAAEGFLQRALTISRSLGASAFSSDPPLQLGRIKVARGDFDAATAVIDEGMSIAREGDYHSSLLLAHCFLAEMEIVQGNPNAAVRRLAEVLTPEDIEREDSIVSLALMFWAWAHVESGNLTDADRYAQLAIKRLTEENSVIELLTARRVDGMIAAARGEYERAAATFDEILDAARTIPYPYAEAYALYEYAMMDLGRGNRDDAMPRLGEALRIFQKLGARPNIDQIQRALTSAHTAGGAAHLPHLTGVAMAESQH